MLYYGWPKIRDPWKNARDFDATGFFGTLVLAAEFFGGVLVLLGMYVWVAVSCRSRSACRSWPWGRAPIVSDTTTLEGRP